MSTSTDSQKKHSWSFGFKNPKRNIKQAISHLTQPASLPKQFFVQLIKLEADFHNKVYTLDTLEQLTQYYAKAVEHYDNLKDEISSYFILKIQDILATRKSLTMLSEHRQKMEESGNRSIHNTPNKGIQAKEAEVAGEIKNNSLEGDNIVEENSEEDDDFEIDHLEHKRNLAKRNRTNRASITQIRNEKQRFVHFFYKMENEKMSEKQNMNNVLNDFENARGKNDSCINNNLESQRERLRNRLEQRRIESFQSQTMSVTSYRNPLNLSNTVARRTHNGPTLDLVLKELDEGDEVEFGRSISGSGPNTRDISPRGFGVLEEDDSNPLSTDDAREFETQKALMPKNVNLTEKQEDLGNNKSTKETNPEYRSNQNRKDAENEDIRQGVDSNVPLGQ